MIYYALVILASVGNSVPPVVKGTVLGTFPDAKACYKQLSVNRAIWKKSYQPKPGETSGIECVRMTNGA